MATSEPGLTKPATRAGSVSSTLMASLSSGMVRVSADPGVAELLADDLLSGVDRAERDLVVDGGRGAQRSLDHVLADHVGLLELAGGLGFGHGLAGARSPRWR